MLITVHVLTFLAADPDDTRTEDVIVKAAQALDAANAPLTQVGIQFVQIGEDISATEFLETLDNSLKTKHKIRVSSRLAC